MYIKKIKLKNYRNYDDVEIDFGQKLNIIIGNNAQGKTNLLESIYVLALTKSFLSIIDKGLIKFGSKYTKIEGNIIKNIRSKKDLEIVLNEKGKVVKINNKEIKKISDYISVFNVVIFSVDNIIVFRESPVSRRRYFNIQISQINRPYIKILCDYNTIIRQRNEFLKKMNINNQHDIDYMDILNDKYADLSISIYNYRCEYVEYINRYLNDMFKNITGDIGLELKYLSSVIPNKEKYLTKIKENLSKDIMYGMTIIGPNRDDFHFKLNNKDLSLYGSQGQMRSAVLALKLSEVKLFTECQKDTPILLLDDIFSELDIEKRNNLLSILGNDIQTIITTTDIENISENIRKNANIYTIENGKVIGKQLEEGE